MSASDLPPIPSLRHFRLSVADGIADLVFDMDGSLVNVLSQASIADFGEAVAWIGSSSVQGVIIRSAKSLFCAGGDLDELGSAYTRIMSLPAEQRSRAAFDHFAPMNKHLLALESSGKPVVAILDGAALGGGLELVLATHHRVATARVTLGLPEVPLGLMPGAGGTQRLPRLIGVDAALPILLDGRSLTAEEALQIGLVDEIVEDDEQLTAARTYIENQSTAVQRVELAGWKNPGRDWRDLVHDRRKAVISETAANLPAPLAVLDCVLEGFERPLAEAIAIESRAFATLIQRPEPRDMVRALFVGAQDYHRRKKKGALPDGLESIGELIDAGLHKAQSELVREGVPSVLVDAVGARLGFGPPQSTSSKDEPTRSQAGYWFDDSAAGKAGAAARRLMDGAASGVAHFVQNIDPADHALIDYLAITRHGFPCWSGGPIAWVQNQHTRTVIEKEPA